MPVIWIDADGCPVKDEVYRVAKRYGIHVRLVANTGMFTPDADWIELIQVIDHPEAADDYIAEHAQQNDIVITGDIPLAARCLKQGAYVIGHKGRVFTDASIGQALVSREISSHLREQGLATSGPAPFSARDRSQFLQKLDEAVHATRKNT